ncbi:uncharacterized protein LOC120862649 [Oryx dammah]|uniref:uncharacterized protein LOC120862649 n=1 Tax=Oryx dammah TaxID=59534 RepID=UPI001A9B04BB|nr:uncharacterized protein LOC120862649 [Oryx dammah]
MEQNPSPAAQRQTGREPLQGAKGLQTGSVRSESCTRPWAQAPLMRAGASERQSRSWTLNPRCQAAAVTTGETANTAEQTGVPDTKHSSLRQTTPNVPGGSGGKCATSSFWHQGLPSGPWTETLLPPDASEWSTRICVECEESHKEAGPERKTRLDELLCEHHSRRTIIPSCRASKEMRIRGRRNHRKRSLERKKVIRNKAATGWQETASRLRGCFNTALSYTLFPQFLIRTKI